MRRAAAQSAEPHTSCGARGSDTAADSRGCAGRRHIYFWGRAQCGGRVERGDTCRW